jgi:dihydrofolate reductase
MVMKGGTIYTFITDGIDVALGLAKEAAGGKNVSIWGGAGIFQQYLKAGLVDEIQIHLIPIVLGQGVRLFELGTKRIDLKTTRTIPTPSATHLRFTIAT